MALNQPIGGVARTGCYTAAAHRPVQMIQQSNRAKQQLILRNQRQMQYFTVPQPDLDLLNRYAAPGSNDVSGGAAPNFTHPREPRKGHEVF